MDEVEFIGFYIEYMDNIFHQNIPVQDIYWSKLKTLNTLTNLKKCCVGETEK